MELSPQFNSVMPARKIRISPAVKSRYARDKTGRSDEERILDQHERGLLTTPEAGARLLGAIDHPLHPKSGTVVKGTVVKDSGELGALCLFVVRPSAGTCGPSTLR